MRKSQIRRLCLPLIFITNSAYSQLQSKKPNELNPAKGSSKGVPVDTVSFSEVRKNDFTRLLGIESNFEGLTLKYDKDKSNLNLGHGFSRNSGKIILNASASIGTSTDILHVFNQDILPVFSFSLSLNRLLFGTKYFYDGEYKDNYAALNSSSDIGKIQTGSSEIFYKKQIRKNIRSGEYDANTTVYTSKRLIWIGLTAKYNNDQYSFFDPNRLFKMQQYDTAFHTFTGQVSFSGYWGWNKNDYKWNGYRPEFLYATFYAFYNKGNDIQQLKKVPVNDVKKVIVDSASNTVRDVLSKSQSYYQGEYFEYYNFGIGAKFYFSPIKYLTFDFFGEDHYVRQKDKMLLGLNNNANYGAGIFVYTGSNNKSSVNIGVEYKRVQDLTDSKWMNQLQFTTSVPISLFDDTQKK